MESSLVSTENQPALLADLEHQVETCLGCWFNETLTAEYRQARCLAPDLVARESPVVNFLRTEKWHILRAAKRLALYWKLRKDLFGVARFLRPLHQTGAGALTTQQVAMVRSGFLAMTTTTNDNTTKHPVLIVDHGRLPKTVKCIDPAVVFYLISVTSCAAGQCPGYTIVQVIQRGWSATLRPLSGCMIQRLLQSMPFQVYQVLIVRALERQSPAPPATAAAAGADQYYWWLDDLAHQQQVESDLHLGRRGAAKYVTGDSVQATVKLLQQCGVDKSCIPVDLGGDYVYNTHFEEWISKRLTEERALMMEAPPMGNTTLANAATTRSITDIVLRATTAATQQKQQQQQQDGMLVAEQRRGESRTDFEKRRRKLYGKRAYKKKRSCEAQLQQQRNHLQQCIAALRTDNRRMEALLVRARFILAQHNNNKKQY